MSKPFSFEEFKEIYSKVPRLCVEVVIQNPDGVLLTLRSVEPHKDKWHLPGGTVFFREDPVAAVERVAKSELNVEVVVGKCLGYIAFLDQEAAGGFDYPVSLAFLGTPDSYDFRLDDQAAEAKFFKELPENTLREQKEFIEESGLL